MVGEGLMRWAATTVLFRIGSTILAGAVLAVSDVGVYNANTCP